MWHTHHNYACDENEGRGTVTGEIERTIERTQQCSIIHRQKETKEEHQYSKNPN